VISVFVEEVVDDDEEVRATAALDVEVFRNSRAFC
jgi:hypothetical protein